jgi:hypothetical protein
MTSLTVSIEDKMTVDDLILEITRRGLRLNNLFQLHDGRWQANLTDGVQFWQFGRGSTAVEALQAALKISATTKPELGVRPKAEPALLANATINDLEI